MTVSFVAEPALVARIHEAGRIDAVTQGEVVAGCCGWRSAVSGGTAEFLLLVEAGRRYDGARSCGRTVSDGDDGGARRFEAAAVAAGMRGRGEVVDEEHILDEANDVVRRHR